DGIRYFHVTGVQTCALPISAPRYRPLFVVSSKGDVTSKPPEADTEAQERRRRSREKLRQQLKEGKLEERDVEVEVQQQGFPMLEIGRASCREREWGAGERSV